MRQKLGVSICIDNMHIPSKKSELIDRAQVEVESSAKSI